MTPRILIAGIGNVLLQDDGLGPHVVARLEAEYEFDHEVELLDIGTPTLDFVDYLRGREVLVLVDALGGGGQPGEILTFDKEQLKEFLPNMRLSAHQPCLHETLHAAEISDIDLKDVLLVGIIGRSFNVGTDLGPYVSRALPEVLDLIVEYVRQRGGTVEKRKAPLPIKSWWNSVAPA